MGFKKIGVYFLCFTGVLLAYTPPSGAVSKLNSYRGYSDLTKAAGSMDLDTYTYNLTTWQINHGGFYKAFASKYVNPWNGSDAKSDIVNKDGTALGTIDNNATIQEMRLLAVRYKSTTNSSYKTAFKNSFSKAIGFLVAAQRSKGAWPQMHPKRGNYSDQATYNDNAMVRVMVLAKDIVDGVAPFDSDIVTESDRTKMQQALNKAVDFALKSQIYNNNVPTVWCAQHDTSSYAPVEARSYELASKSGSESAGIVWFLMNWPDQTPEIQKAIKGALAWYKKTKVADMKYSDGNFVSSSGSSLWYRFYEVNNDNYFFCDRGGVSTKTQDITKLSDDRRYGYQWAGDYGSALLNVEASYLNAISSLSSSSSSTPSSSSSSSLSSSSSSSTPSFSCGDKDCLIQIEGEDFCSADGVFEDKNAGFSGTGYVNPNNALETSVSYPISASVAGDYTFYIRYANGTATARDAQIVTNENKITSIQFSSTSAWTTWNTIPISVSLPQGHSFFIFNALTSDGLPNIDWIGSTDQKLTIGSCTPTRIENKLNVTSRVSGHIQNQHLYLRNIPNSNVQVRILTLNGKQLHLLHANSSNVVPLPSMKGELYLFEVYDNKNQMGSFLLPLIK